MGEGLGVRASGVECLLRVELFGSTLDSRVAPGDPPDAHEIAALHFRLNRLFCHHDNENGNGQWNEQTGQEIPGRD